MDLEQKWFSGAMLKWIALISMLMDHFGAAFFVIYTSYYDGTQEFAGADFFYYYILRGIGRTAFPIFCFMLVEGFFYTKSRMKYLIRLILFCLVSEVPFDLAVRAKTWDISSQNVFWTLAIGFGTIWIMETIRNSNKVDWILRGLLSISLGLLTMLLAEFLKTDYGAFGILLILIFYLFRANRKWACGLGYLSMIWEFACFPAFILLYFYNGKKGRGVKYFFYIFYPLHLFLLYKLRIHCL